MADTLRTVGRYELIEVIGRGGAAVVYLANQADLGRHVALKELSPHHAGDPSFAQRFIEESRLLSTMNHQNVVTVHEYFEHDGLPYIAMEYVPRGSLRPYLTTTLSQAQVAGVIEGVLAGLGHGAEYGIIHRDLKPENLLVGADGNVKIADFGVARALGEASARSWATITGTTIGTPAYMAPEQALGKDLANTTDLYSLGIVIWEMLAGHTPFESHETPMAVLYQQVNEPAPPITTVRKDIDPRFAAWLERMLAKDPADRFASPASAWDQLEDVVIDVLGPRWRRDSHLGDPPPEPFGTEPRPRVPPTLGDEEPAEDSAGAGDVVSDTPQQSRGSDTVHRGSRRHQEDGAGSGTVLRESRRHQEPDGEQVSPAAGEAAGERRGRRSVPMAALLGGLLVAALLIGGLVGVLTASKHQTTKTTTTPAEQLADAVPGIVNPLLQSRHSDLASYNRAKTYRQEAGEANKLSGDYSTANASLSKLPGDVRGLAAAAALKRALASAGGGWSQLAQAAQHKDKRAYEAGQKGVAKDEGNVLSAVRRAEQG